jgi:hypothetical protein
MRIREYQMIKAESATITVRKDEKKYKSTYSVCFFSANLKVSIKATCPNRTAAKGEVIRLLKLYTNLTMSQILKLK